MEFVQPIRNKKMITAIKKFLKATNLRDYCLFTVGINSGLRISDLLKLRIADVIDKNGNIKERIYIREKKTNKVKDFPISEAASKALKEYLQERKDCSYEEPLFISRKQHTGMHLCNGIKRIRSSTALQNPSGSGSGLVLIPYGKLLATMHTNQGWILL